MTSAIEPFRPKPGSPDTPTLRTFGLERNDSGGGPCKIAVVICLATGSANEQSAAMISSNQSLFGAATVSWQRIPKSAWLSVLLVGVLSSATNLATWVLGNHSTAMTIVETLPIMLGWIAAVYLGTIGILGVAPSMTGFARFLSTTIVLLVPFAATLLGLIVAKPLLAQNARVSILFVGLVGGWLAICFLPAWPTANALTARMTSPVTVFLATRGHRWSLLGLALAVSGISNSNLVPKMAVANNLSEALLIGVGNALLGLVPFAFTCGIAASAWQFAVRNDPSLAAD